MDTWVEEEIARELEQMGVDDIESADEGDFTESNKLDVLIPEGYNFQKYQCVQASYLNSDLDIAECNGATVHHITGTSIQSPANSWDLSVLDNDSHMLSVLKELRQQEQMDRDSIMKEINEKKIELESFVAKRKEFLARVEEAEREHNLAVLRRKTLSCIVIQSHWRGYRSRQQVRILMDLRRQSMENKKMAAALIVQRNWRVSFRRKNSCSLKIQKCWRHYRQRKIIASLLSKVREKLNETSTITVNVLDCQETHNKEQCQQHNATVQHDIPTLSPLTPLNAHVTSLSTLDSRQHTGNSDSVINDTTPSSVPPIIPFTGKLSPSCIHEAKDCNANLTKHEPSDYRINESIGCDLTTKLLVNQQQHEETRPTPSIDTIAITLSDSQGSIQDLNKHSCVNSGLNKGGDDKTLDTQCVNHDLLDCPQDDTTDIHSEDTPVPVNEFERSLETPDGAHEEIPSSEEATLCESRVIDIGKSEKDDVRRTVSSVWSSTGHVANKAAIQAALSELIETPSVEKSQSHENSNGNTIRAANNTLPSEDENNRKPTKGKRTNEKPSAAPLHARSILSTSFKISTKEEDPVVKHNTSVSSPCLMSTITQSHNSNEQDVTTELQSMVALRKSRSKEQITADLSRTRMSQMFTSDQISDMAEAVRKGETYATRIEHAASPLSPSAWAGLVEERLKAWKEKRLFINNKRSHRSFSNHSVRTPSLSSGCVPLSSAQILSASPQGTAIDEVALVHLYRTRAPIRLECLSQCLSLSSLFLAKCQLTSFYNIGGTRPSLLEIALPTNAIDTVDFSQTPCLSFLDLSENRLASIHGLKSCGELLELCLEENRVARLDGLEGCVNLQKLTVEGNLIIDSSGIACLADLQYLSLGENHLPSLVGIEHCTVLQSALLQQNNLQTCPVFSNHCLLRELVLSENCLSDIALLERAWLPLLQTLNIANNCISAIDSLTCCVMLKSFHLQHNNIYDLAGFLQSIRGCYELEEISTVGNPIEEEPKYRRMLLKAIPGLKTINGEDASRGNRKKHDLPELISKNPLYMLCKRQIKEQDNTKAKHQEMEKHLHSNELKDPGTVSSLLQTKVINCKEYGRLLSCHLKEQVTFDGVCQLPLYERIKIKRNHSALVIQTAWRCHRQRRAFTLVRQSTLTIQSWWKCCKAKQIKSTIKSNKEKAAIIIQAHTRGYLLRKRLRKVLSQVNHEEMEEDIEISFDESFLSDDLMRPMTPTDEVLNRFMATTTDNRQQYTNGEQYTKQNEDKTVPKFTLPGGIEEDETICSAKQHRSSAIKGLDSVPLKGQHGKPDAENDTWCFSSQVTADLMNKRVQRHRKLQRAANQRSKLQDPSIRLAVFNHRRTSDSTTHSRRSTPLSHSTTPDNQQQTVFRWAHEKKIVHNELLSSTTGTGSSPSKHFTGPATSMLPQLEPHVLAGHSPRLISSSAQNEVIRKKGLLNSPTKPIKSSCKKSPSASVYDAWN